MKTKIYKIHRKPIWFKVEKNSQEQNNVAYALFKMGLAGAKAIALTLLAFTLQAQSPEAVQLIAGRPNHVEQMHPDTVLRTYDNDRLFVYYVNNDVRRTIEVLSNYQYRRERKRLSVDAWTLQSDTIQCRLTEWNDERVMECRKGVFDGRN